MAELNDESGIVVRDLTIRYGDFTAVDQLSFTINSGEVFGLLGPNGAGKTTTFLTLTQQIRPSSGSIEILGLDLVKDFQTLKKYFGFVPDLENHFDEFTAYQNLRIYCDLYHIEHDKIMEVSRFS